MTPTEGQTTTEAKGATCMGKPAEHWESQSALALEYALARQDTRSFCRALREAGMFQFRAQLARCKTSTGAKTP